MADLEDAVFGIIAAEIDQLTADELIASMQRNVLDGPKMGVMVPGSGCKFYFPQHDDLRRETQPKFECDLKACMIQSLTSHALGILQDADLMVDVANVATARNRLIGVLETIFSEQKSTEIAARLMETLETTNRAPVSDDWAD